MGPSEGWWGQVEVFGAEERGMAWGEKKCGGVHGFYSEKWSQRVRERERERDVLSFESFDFVYLLSAEDPGLSGVGGFVGAYEK